MSEPAAVRDTSTPIEPATSVRWRILAILLAFSFMSWFNRVSMPVAYDERINEQFTSEQGNKNQGTVSEQKGGKDRDSISEQSIGHVYSALLWAYALCMTPGGWLADRYGPRLALTLMGIGSALFVALTGVVGLAGFSATATVVALLMVRAMMGVCTAPIYPASGRAIANWFPPRQRAGANGAVMGAALVGIATSFHIFGGLIDRFDWPGAFLIASVWTAGLGFLWLGYATNTPGEHRGVNRAELRLIGSQKTESALPERNGGVGERGGLQTLLMNRSLILLTLSYAAVGYFEYLFYFWSHYYFNDILKVGKEVSRTYAMIDNLAMAGGMFLGGWLADRLARTWGRRRGRVAVVAGGMLLGAMLLGCGLLTTKPGWIVFWFGLAMAAVGATEGPFWATALELGGRRGATAAGIFNTGGNAGGALAPQLTPLISGAFGWPWGIGLGSVVCLAGASLWFWIRPHERAETHIDQKSEG